jgi:hypothetical protein
MVKMEKCYGAFKTMNDNISISTDDIVESMMRKVSRNSYFEISYRFYEITLLLIQVEGILF